LKKATNIVLFSLVLFVVASAQEALEYEVPLKLPSEVNSVAEEAAVLASPDGQTLYFSRLMFAGNTGGVKGGQDIWSSQSDGNGSWYLAEHNLVPLNNKGDNAVIGVSDDGNTLYLLNKYVGKKTSMGVSYSTRDGDYWPDPIALDIPGLSSSSGFYGFNMDPSGNYLIISMNSTGSMGEEDLYVSVKEGESWTNPLHLGRVINSGWFEITPFITADGKSIYFSSNRSGGFGSADVYKSDRLDDSWTNWSEPVNMGDKINSAGFEAFFSITSSNEIYLCSNRSGLLSDIFKSKILERLVIRDEVEGEVQKAIIINEDGEYVFEATLAAANTTVVTEVFAGEPVVDTEEGSADASAEVEPPIQEAEEPEEEEVAEEIEEVEERTVQETEEEASADDEDEEPNVSSLVDTEEEKEDDNEVSEAFEDELDKIVEEADLATTFESSEEVSERLSGEETEIEKDDEKDAEEDTNNDTSESAEDNLEEESDGEEESSWDADFEVVESEDESSMDEEIAEEESSWEATYEVAESEDESEEMTTTDEEISDDSSDIDEETDSESTNNEEATEDELEDLNETGEVIPDDSPDIEGESLMDSFDSDNDESYEDREAEYEKAEDEEAEEDNENLETSSWEDSEIEEETSSEEIIEDESSDVSDDVSTEAVAKEEALRQSEPEGAELRVADETDLKEEPLVSETSPRREVADAGRVFFDLNSSYFSEEEEAKLASIFDKLEDQAGLQLEVLGYSDNLGEDHYNMWISERRAYRVVLYLVDKGIDSSRMSSKWFGEDNQAANCVECSEEQHQANRRVELILQ